MRKKRTLTLGYDYGILVDRNHCKNKTKSTINHESSLRKKMLSKKNQQSSLILTLASTTVRSLYSAIGQGNTYAQATLLA